MKILKWTIEQLQEFYWKGVNNELIWWEIQQVDRNFPPIAISFIQIFELLECVRLF